ncbi:MAG: NAD(P)/FAD-dependent oxidoreductase [Firmicutes bacterium]|nr:NAD(P)/FAD-dependent oxidoreductase [Bacillota bacterium]
MYDVIIIGKGPAGLSASLYTTRANLKTLVIGKNDSALKKAAKIENYFGFSKPVSGEYLLEEGEKQALRLGTFIIEDEAVSIEKKNDMFRVTTSGGLYEGIAVLIATGQPQKQIKIKNIEKFEGNGISYCTTCDGFFYNNLKVGVLGNKDYAIHEATELEAYTEDITIYTNGKELDLTEKFSKEASKYKINQKVITEVDGEDFLRRIYFDDGTSEEIDGLFIAEKSASSIDFARKLGVITRENSIVVDEYQKTNLEGLFAAGDCTGGLKQVSTAVGQGALAGKTIIEYVRKFKK